MPRSLLALLLPLALASCSTFGTPDTGDITGNVLGTKPTSGTVRLALVGLNTDGTANATGEQITVALPGNSTAYALDFPSDWKDVDGRYEVLAYVDANSNNRYDSGERRTEGNGKAIVYDLDGQSLLYQDLQKGLNEVQNGRRTQSGVIRNHDVTWGQ